MPTAATKGIATAFSNTPQAVDDLFHLGQGGVVLLDVMANDRGGNGKTLYSIDDGRNSDGSPNGSRTSDLLIRDMVGSINYSELGAKIWITADGKVGYDGSTANLTLLSFGQHVTDTFTYSIQLGNGAISWATAQVDIVGTNHTPIVTSQPQTGAVKEDVTLVASGHVTATDADIGDHLHYSGNATGIFGAFSIDPNSGSWQYLLNNAAANVQALAEGETHTENFSVIVTDDHGAMVKQAVKVQVVGTNDAPTIVVANGDSDLVLTTSGAAATGGLSIAGQEVVLSGMGESVFAPQLVSLSNGTWAAAWNDQVNVGATRLQIFDTGGHKIGAEITVSGQQGLNVAPAITPLQNGTFVVSWTQDEKIGGIFNGVIDIRAQIYNNDGTLHGGEIAISSHPLDSTVSSIAATASGGFVATYFDNQQSIWAHQFDSSGNAVGSEFLVTNAGSNFAPIITSLAGGGYAVVWGHNVTGNPYEILGQVYDANNHLVGAEFDVGRAELAAANDTNNTAVAGLSNGGFVVTWEDQSGTTGGATNGAISGQLFDASGNKVGASFLVNPPEETAALGNDVAARPDGGFVVSWINDVAGQPHVKTQVFDVNAQKVGSELSLDASSASHFGTLPSIAVSSNGDTTVVWADQINGQSVVATQVLTATASGHSISESGTLTVRDPDLTDTVYASVTGVTHNGATGGITDAQFASFFSVSPAAVIDNSHTLGQLTWIFNSAPQTFEYLGADDQLVLQYTIHADDGHNPLPTNDHVVTIHIVGQGGLASG